MNIYSLKQLTTLAVTTALTWLGREQAVAPSTGSEPTLKHLNTLMHTHYSAAKQHAASTILAAGPIIVASGFSDITLAWDGDEYGFSYADSLTDNLKAMAHVPLALAVMIQQQSRSETTTSGSSSSIDENNEGEGEDEDDVIRLPEQAREAAREYMKALNEARDQFANLDFNTTQLARQERIAKAADTVLSALVEFKGISRKDFTKFSKIVAPLAMANVDDAARRMLDNINSRVTRWRAVVGSEHWKDLRVVIMAPHMPRRGYLSGQYFARLLHDADHGGDEEHEKRLLFLEIGRGGGMNAAMDFLATHAVDSGVASLYFQDGERLHRDVLADAAARYLDEMELLPFP